jgi:hypothetical protein
VTKHDREIMEIRAIVKCCGRTMAVRLAFPFHSLKLPAVRLFDLGCAIELPFLVGKGGFEPPTSASRTLRANQAALLPVSNAIVVPVQSPRPAGLGRQRLPPTCTSRRPRDQAYRAWLAKDLFAGRLRRRQVNRWHQRRVVIGLPIDQRLHGLADPDRVQGFDQPASNPRPLGQEDVGPPVEEEQDRHRCKTSGADLEGNVHGDRVPAHSANLKVTDHEVGRRVLQHWHDDVPRTGPSQGHARFFDSRPHLRVDPRGVGDHQQVGHTPRLAHGVNG